MLVLNYYDTTTATTTSTFCLEENSRIILHILFGYKFGNYLPHFVWKKIPELSSTYCLEEDSGIILHILFGCKFFSSMHYNP